jgi:hypothetical protein
MNQSLDGCFYFNADGNFRMAACTTNNAFLFSVFKFLIKTHIRAFLNSRAPSKLPV